MSLSVTSVSPSPNATDVVLGIPITIVFNEEINTATFTNQSFALTCPGGTEVITPGSLITKVPTTLTNNQYIAGTSTFSNTGGFTTVTFTPSVPLNPNTIYTGLIIGSNSMMLAPLAITDTDGNPLTSSYTWTFTTGNLDVITPPIQSPLPGALTTFIQTDQIQVSPLRPLINQDIDAGYVMTITFPAPIDTTSFSLSDVVASIEPMLNDPLVTLSETLNVGVAINGSNPAQLVITITD